MSDAGAGQRDRSPSFPFIPLKTAIERLVAFEEHHKRAAVPPDRVGPAWVMRPNSSQAQQTLAALKAYGLLETRRGETGRVVAVSEDARTYLRAQQDHIKNEVIRRAALRPKQIETHWREWGSDRPADAACLDELVLKGGFSQDGAEKFLKVYDATIAYAGLADPDNIQIETPRDADEDDLGAGHESSALPPVASAVHAAVGSTDKRVPLMGSERVVFTEEVDAQRYIKLVASGDVDESLLDALADYVKRQRKRLGIPDQQMPIKAARDDPQSDDHTRARLGADRVPGMSG